eukprot:GFYU01010774.1.p1 GENE.GFYU01010774.1~~GFYU01010774.1.p1  ORF type:complete len:360 (-),score=84.08 GFYU01010774.1:162-1241(-)
MTPKGEMCSIGGVVFVVLMLSCQVTLALDEAHVGGIQHQTESKEQRDRHHLYVDEVAEKKKEATPHHHRRSSSGGFDAGRGRLSLDTDSRDYCTGQKNKSTCQKTLWKSIRARHYLEGSCFWCEVVGPQDKPQSAPNLKESACVKDHLGERHWNCQVGADAVSAHAVLGAGVVFDAVSMTGDAGALGAGVTKRGTGGVEDKLKPPADQAELKKLVDDMKAAIKKGLTLESDVSTLNDKLEVIVKRDALAGSTHTADEQAYEAKLQGQEELMKEIGLLAVKAGRMSLKGSKLDDATAEAVDRIIVWSDVDVWELRARGSELIGDIGDEMIGPYVVRKSRMLTDGFSHLSSYITALADQIK